MRTAGLDEAQAGIKIAGRNISNLRYADDTTLIADIEEELKSLFMKVRGEWKSWLKTQHSENYDHGIWSYHFMANRWGNSGNSDRLYFLGLQNPTNGDCSHEIKRHFLLGRKAMTNLDSILKSRDITLPTKGLSRQSYGFSSSHVQMWELAIKKVEHWRINTFELWCWRRLLRVPWTARRSNRSNLKEISPEYSLEGMMLKLKLQYFHHLMWRSEELAH